MNPVQVLIISNPHDTHTARVVGALRELGVHALLFFPETLGQDSFLAIHHGRDATPRIELMTEGQAINLAGVCSVWYRRPRPVGFDSETMTPEAVEFARDEWQAAMDYVWPIRHTRLMFCPLE